MVPMWMFPKIRVGPPKWMVKIMENPIKMDDLGVPLFLETPMFLRHFHDHLEGVGHNPILAGDLTTSHGY